MPNINDNETNYAFAKTAVVGGLVMVGMYALYRRRASVGLSASQYLPQEIIKELLCGMG